MTSIALVTKKHVVFIWLSLVCSFYYLLFYTTFTIIQIGKLFMNEWMIGLYHIHFYISKQIIYFKTNFNYLLSPQVDLKTI